MVHPGSFRRNSAKLQSRRQLLEIHLWLEMGCTDLSQRVDMGEKPHPLRWCSRSEWSACIMSTHCRFCCLLVAFSLPSSPQLNTATFPVRDCCCATHSIAHAAGSAARRGNTDWDNSLLSHLLSLDNWLCKQHSGRMGYLLRPLLGVRTWRNISAVDSLARKWRSPFVTRVKRGA